MSVYQKVADTLATLGIPVVPGVYTGTETTYCSVHYDTQPDGFADDAPRCERCLIRVHLHGPLGTDTSALRRQIKELLFEAEFTWPAEQDLTDSVQEGRAEEQHYVLSCELTEAGASGG